MAGTNRPSPKTAIRPGTPGRRGALRPRRRSDRRPPVCSRPRLPATRSNATISVAGSCTKLNRSSNRRSASTAAQRCSLACIFATRPNTSVGAPPFGNASRGIAVSLPHPIAVALPHVVGFPDLGVLRRLRPARCVQQTVRLSHPPSRFTPGWEPTPGGSRVHCCSLDRGGAQLCPCGLAMATPQTFTMASPDAGFTGPGSSRRTETRRDAPLPAQIRQIRAGIALRDFTTLVPRVLLSITLTGPTPSGSADAPRLCQGCSHPPRHLPDQAALSSTDPLRRADDGGLSPPLEQQRLTAHEARLERLRDHLRRSYRSLNNQLTP